MYHITSDTSREGITFWKIKRFFHVIFSSDATRTLSAYKKFSEIDFTALWNSGKRGMIIDMDDTIAPYHSTALSENMNLLKELIEQDWKIAIYSNRRKTERYNNIEAIGIPIIITEFAKPDMRGFQRALEELHCFQKETVMIGDNYITDGGSINAGIDFIKVAPIARTDTMTIGYFFQDIFRSIADKIAIHRGDLIYK